MKKIAHPFLLSALLCLTLFSAAAWGRQESWEKTLEERTALMWVDGQVFEGFVLGARARLSITWLPRSLMNRLEKDPQAEDWVMDGLSCYYSGNAELRKRMKGRDVLALNYRAQKNWAFDPTELRVGDYAVAEEDVLGHPDLRDTSGPLRPGAEGTVLICVPSLKPGTTVRITLGPDSVDLKLPRR